MTWGVLVLVALGSYRLARLICLDDVSEPLRDALLARYPPVVEGNLVVQRWPVVLVNCMWCVSVWTSAVLVLAMHGAGYSLGWSFDVLAWLAICTVVGLLSRLES